MNEINVAIADDNERILDLLGDMIDADKELKLVGKANNGEDAYEMIRQKQPDCSITGSDPSEDGWIKCYGSGKQ